MSSVGKRCPRAAARRTTLRPWSAAWAEAFEPWLNPEWSPPASVKVSGSLQRGTMTAQFEAPDGSNPTIYARYRAVGGGIEIYESGVRFNFKIKGRSK